MITIGMIGADSTHTEAYARLVNLPEGPLYGRGRVVKLWGEDAAQAAQKAEQCQIDQVVESPAAAVEGVDLVMDCNRYGDDHPPHARVAIAAGKPTFVDKPFANDYASAQELVQLAATGGVPLMSCSAVRYAVEVLTLQERYSEFGTLNGAVTSGPAAGDFPNPRARHPFFYGIHPAELLHTLLGPGAVAVATRRTDRADVGLVHYEDGRQGVINLFHASPSLYHGAVYGSKGWGQVDIHDFVGFYTATLQRILAMAESGQPPFPSEWALEVTGILAALVRSAAEGGRLVRIADL